jgi:hypothetical protein
MGTDVVQRPQRPRPVMTAELRRKKRLSFGEGLRAYLPVWLAAAGILLFVWGIVATATLSGGAWPTIVFGGCAFVWGVVWLFMGEDRVSGVFDLAKRRQCVVGERALKRRRHWQDDLARLKELEWSYPRYSCAVARDGTDIRIDVVKHKPLRSSRWVPQVVRWDAEVTQEGYSATTGHGKQPTYQKKVNNPTMENVQRALDQAYMVAEALENKRYAEALKRHQLDALALTVTPPPASEESHAVVHEELRDRMPGPVIGSFETD